MPDDKPASPKADAPKADTLAKELKASLAQRRPRPWKIILAALVLSIAALGLFFWWMIPRPVNEPMQVVALDALVTTTEELEVQAQLLAPPDEANPRPLGGHKVVFHEPPPIFAKAAPAREVEATSDVKGRAAAAWPTPRAAITDFQASSVDLNAKPARHTDQARIFVHEAHKPVLLIDADETLGTDAMIEKAAPKLAEAAKDGWQIVYLALAASNPADFRSARERIARQPKLPRGPVLGRFHALNVESAESARSELLQTIKKRFRGPLQALVGSAAAAQTAHGTGVPTLLIGNAPPPANVPRVAGWHEVLLRLRD